MRKRVFDDKMHQKMDITCEMKKVQCQHSIKKMWVLFKKLIRYGQNYLLNIVLFITPLPHVFPRPLHISQHLLGTWIRHCSRQILNLLHFLKLFLRVSTILSENEYIPIRNNVIDVEWNLSNQEWFSNYSFPWHIMVYTWRKMSNEFACSSALNITLLWLVYNGL